jgi:predicted SnoaL-like aldol condensation-catalyzing enzyme
LVLVSKLFGRSAKRTPAINTQPSRRNPMINTTNNVRDLVVSATTAVFNDKDASAVDRYFAADYKQHSQLVGDGREAFRGLAADLPADFRYEPVRVLADGDLVVAHGIYHGFGATPLVAFDIFRVAGDQIVEHWDALTPLIEQTVSGRSQTDGANEVTNPDATADSRKLVTELAEKVLVGADYSVLTDYISTETYLQHNPGAADGLAGFGAAAAAWAEDGKPLVYERVHQVIAEGEFAFVRAEGEFGGPVSYNDLFRVQDGRIVEHWDVIDPIQGEQPHDNGVF